MLYKGTVSAEMMELWLKLMQDENLNNFYLAGGTALSLQIGHRRSVDIDLFTDKNVDRESIKVKLKDRYNGKIETDENGRRQLKVNGIRVDIVTHNYPLIRSLRIEDGLRLASIEDIAAMKIKVITDQGTREKDFADLYCLLQKNSLKKLVGHYVQKYPDFNIIMAAKSILNFEKMKSENIVLLHEKYDWNKVESRLRQAILFPDKKFRKSQGLRP